MNNIYCVLVFFGNMYMFIRSEIYALIYTHNHIKTHSYKYIIYTHTLHSLQLRTCTDASILTYTHALHRLQHSPSVCSSVRSSMPWRETPCSKNCLNKRLRTEGNMCVWMCECVRVCVYTKRLRTEGVDVCVCVCVWMYVCECWCP
jgi:hypothetical protein